MKPREHTTVRQRAMKHAVKGFEADRYPILKKTLFRTPMN
jgi:hemoglobin-like flavoprotein